MSMGDLSTFCSLPQSLSSEIYSFPCKGHSHLLSGSEYLFSSFPSGSCTNFLLWGNWFPHFFYLPIIALGIVTVPVLCAIEYLLASNNNNGDI
jgi:hypothetical protein